MLFNLQIPASFLKSAASPDRDNNFLVRYWSIYVELLLSDLIFILHCQVKGIIFLEKNVYEAEVPFQFTRGISTFFLSFWHSLCQALTQQSS